jgi:adenylate cyclase
MTLSPEIKAVLDHHFPPAEAELPGPLPEPLERVLVFGGLDPERPGPAERRVIEAIAAALDAGFPAEALSPSAQAFGRGLGRIVTAESDNVRRLLRAQPQDDHAVSLDRLLERYLPASQDVFTALHSAMLREALEDALSAESLAEPEQPDRVVSLVDICESTPYLATADRTATREMVDALYEAGRTAELGRGVWTVKYVGDGVFLVGRDVREVTDASLHAIGVLEGRLPLRARAGLACGPVVRRAGDYFGPVVNLAQRLTTVAAPTTVVAAEPAASRLDDTMVGARDQVELRGFDGLVSVAIVHPPR